MDTEYPERRVGEFYKGIGFFRLVITQGLGFTKRCSCYYELNKKENS